MTLAAREMEKADMPERNEPVTARYPVSVCQNEKKQEKLYTASKRI